MSGKILTQMKITKDQQEWLETEAKRTGNTVTAVVRGLIQDRVNQKAGNPE